MNTFLFPHIRKAEPTDYKSVAPLIVQAMEDLACTFANTKNPLETYPLFENFFQQSGNQYSFENCLVYEENNEIEGSIIAYDGALLPEYREPFLKYISENYNVRDLVIENETMEGEVYIDTISVYPTYQGKGIGKKLLRAIQMKSAAEGHKKIGLLVDLNNPHAKKLYSSLGYKSVGTKKLGNGVYEHLQLTLV
ncbi:GNAT family N-acetyltransferase [Aequorivita sp. H23M31]|uniref:GNAT family N-acetyltransferase n=1 Tax=Aequorivita ciconiae TaxID=2494375 RepID=A0A410G5J6_9FLAO|nr:GNAT family N-acetyltransferase [Aequorivita sp. H23M31]QAA82465.1 GNAT family N-acetyltransferase [Aequorivita sp. H23M31]